MIQAEMQPSVPFVLSSQGQEKKVTASHTETRSPCQAKFNRNWRQPGEFFGW